MHCEGRIPMKRVKLIALDMDGTLLASDHNTIPQRNIEAIRRAQAAGIGVCINTGRMLEDAGDFLRRYDLPCMIISGDGTRVATAPLPEGKVILRRDLSPEDACRALEICLASGLTIHAFEDGFVNSVIGENGTPYHLLERGLIGVRYGEEALFAAAKRGLLKIFVVTEGFAGSVYSDKIPPLREKLRKALPHLEISSSGLGNIEIVSSQAGKGRALAAVAKQMGIGPENVMAVGDAGNDLNMLEYAYHSVAMGNARPEVLAVCRYRTSSNNECGVAEIIERVLAAQKE